VKRRAPRLGDSTKKHAEYAHNALDAYEESARKANALAREGKCKEALDEAVRAAWLRGVADTNASAGKIGAGGHGRLPTRFNRGGPGIAMEALGQALSRCKR
jgi:hypothetical protein